MKQTQNVNPIETHDGFWSAYTNTQGAKRSKYKLHIALPPSHFSQYYQRVDRVLKAAVQTGLIYGFKKNIQAAADSKEKHRLYDNPFTIYLFEDINFPRLAQFCYEIEALLTDTSVADPKTLSSADLPLTERVTFRQESLNDQYVAIASATPLQLKQLAQEAKKSKEYKELQHYCNDEKSWTSEITAYECVDFYNIAYQRIEKELYLGKVALQFKAACELLDIDKANFQEKLKQNNINLARELLKKAVKQYQLKVHPDKNSKCKVIAGKLFQLSGKAKAALDFLIDNPAIDVIDAPALELKQDAKQQQHQYELAQGFKEDPYAYILGMMQPNTMVGLKQYWETRENRQVQITYGEERVEQKEEKLEQKSEGLTLSIPQERQLFVKPHEVILPGWQAFYHLFMSDALPDRFDSGHLSKVLDKTNKDGTLAHRELVQKALTTPKFIEKIRAENLISLARQATTEGIISIGLRVDEIFLYYYRFFPETVHWAEEALDKNYFKEFDAKRVENEILESPDLLYRFPQYRAMDDMLKLGPRLCQFILNDQDLLVKIQNHWEYHIVPSFIKECCSDRRPIEEMVIKNLLVTQQLPGGYLSLACLERLLSFLEQAKMTVGEFTNIDIPVWALVALRMELAARQQAASPLTVKEKNVIPSQYFSIENFDYAYIKQQLLSKTPKTPIDCTLLSEKILVTLVEDSEVDVSFYYEIGLALQSVNPEKAKGLLVIFAKQFPDISLPVAAKSSEFKIPEVLLSWRQVAREERCNALQKQWLNIMVKPPINIQQLSVIKEQLAYLVDDEKRHAIWSSIEDQLSERYSKSYKTFCDYDIPQDEKERAALREEIIAYKAVCSHLPHAKRSHFSHFDSVLGDDAFSTLCCILDSTEELPNNTLNIKVRELPVMVALEQLFFFYDCLGEVPKFYGGIHLLVSIPDHSLPEELQHATTFNSKAIKSHLMSYLNHELAVYFAGKRENVSYKQHSIMGMRINQHNIQDLGKLRSLYVGLGEKAHYRSLLKQGWERITDDADIRRIKPDIEKHEPHFARLRLEWWTQRILPPLFASPLPDSKAPLSITAPPLQAITDRPEPEVPSATAHPQQQVGGRSEEKISISSTKMPAEIVEEIKKLLVTRQFRVHYLMSTSQGHEITDLKGNKNYVSRSAYNIYQAIQTFERAGKKDYKELFDQIRNELRNKTDATVGRSCFVFWERSEETAKNYKAIIKILDSDSMSCSATDTGPLILLDG